MSVLAIVKATAAIVGIVGIIFVIVGFWKSDLLFYIGILLILIAGLLGFIGDIDSMI